MKKLIIFAMLAFGIVAHAQKYEITSPDKIGVKSFNDIIKIETTAGVPLAIIKSEGKSPIDLEYPTISANESHEFVIFTKEDKILCKEVSPTPEYRTLYQLCNFGAVPEKMLTAQKE